MALSTLERHRQIAQFVHNQERVSVQEICDRFAISLATARRDLDALAEQGKIQRVHGGAVSLHAHAQAKAHANGLVEPPPALPRAGEQSDEKARIGAAAVALIQDGETIFLGSGTTVLEVALRLRNRRRLNVITNSLLVLNVLTTAPDITVVSLGGLFNRAEMSFIGHITQQSLSEVRADKVFLGIGAVDVQHGLTNTDLQETLTDRAILKIGREAVLLADHTKCGRAAAAFVAPLSAVQTLITDNATPQKFVDGARAAGVRVITA
jgi:DeoR/GlpR family transcriptional regulator of sugar metabolism